VEHDTALDSSDIFPLILKTVITVLMLSTQGTESHRPCQLTNLHYSTDIVEGMKVKSQL